MCEYYTQNRYAPDIDDWPPYHPKHYTPLTIIHHTGRCSESEIAAVANELTTSKSNIRSSTIKSINDIFVRFERNESYPYRILIEGAPGIGKTILSKEIAFQWANRTILTNKTLLFLVFMRDPEIQKITSVKLLASYFFESESLVSVITDWLVETNGQYLTIVIDGYDEVSEDNRSSLVSGIISRKKVVKVWLSNHVTSSCIIPSS